MGNCSYPILHEDVLTLFHQFLKLKKVHGTSKEKAVYESMPVIDLIDRLIKKRPLAFVGPSDSNTLRNGKQADYHSWTLIGREDEKIEEFKGQIRNVPNFKDYMSYDEVKLSVFLQMSSPVAPINSGNRHNRGVPNQGSIQHDSEAVYVGAVGARFEKPGFMEHEDFVLDRTKSKNTTGQLFQQFYQLATQDKPDEFLKLKSGRDFNVQFYKYRMGLSAETYLLEANSR